MGTLAAGVAHEINNILTPVLAYAQLARKNPGDRQLVKKALEKTIFGIEAASHIAENILGFTSNHQKSTEEADIESVTTAALDCLAQRPDNRGIQIETHIEPGIKAAISPIALQHVLINLLLNACHALKQNGGSLSVSAISTADNTVELRVIDSGPGIDPEIAGRIFEPFITLQTAAESNSVSSRSDNVSNRNTTSAGLGLAVCKYLIENAGGSIGAESVQGDGTTFTVLLPKLQQIGVKAVS